jgi:hypothetical protein
MKGVLVGLISLFIVSAVYIFGDPLQVIGYNFGMSYAPGQQNILDLNLGNWRLALPLLIAVILLYTFQQGRKVDTYEMYRR